MIAIGDIHGQLEQLKILVAQLPCEKLVFLGDYIGRGTDSKGVVRFLQSLKEQRECIFLMGNHERMCLDAVNYNDHRDDSRLWLNTGGSQNLQNYDTNFHQEDIEWFDSLRISYEDDNTIYVHAGIDVTIPFLYQQEEGVVLWIRGAFFNRSEEWDGKQILFGHTPTTTMGLAPGNIFRAGKFVGIDTGCFFTGILTAFHTVTEEFWQAFGPAPWIEK